MLTLLHDGAAHTVATDGEGAFRFAPPSPGRYELVSIAAAGYLPFAADPGQSPVALEARPGVRLDGVTLYLEPAVERDGLVLDARDAPLAGAEVRLLDGDDRFASDAQGRFRFHAPDGATLEARKPGFAIAWAAVERTGRTTLRLVPLPDGGASETIALAGRVVDPAGRPVEGALVTAGPPRAPFAVEPPPARAFTDGEGRFAFADLAPAREFSVEARAPAFAPARAEHAAPGARDLVLTLRAGGVLRGAVRDSSTGKPLAAFAVVLWPVIGPLERGPRIDAARLDAGGRYAVDGLAPGRFRATAIARGFAPADEIEIAIPPSLEPVEQDFALGRGAEVRGRVVEKEGGAPIAGARVSLEGSVTPDAPLPALDDALTDGNGEFRLSGLAPGLRSLLVTAERHHGRILGLRVTEGAPPLTVELARVADGEEPHVELVGIGAVLAGKGDALVIGRVLPSGGAAQAGLVAGDAILTVDGAPVVALGFGQAIQRIRGPEGSTVELGLRRADGANQVLAVSRMPIQH